MKKTIIIAFLLGTTILFAQQKGSTFIQEIPVIKEQLKLQEKQIILQNDKISEILETNIILSKKQNSQQSTIEQLKIFNSELKVITKNQNRTIDSLMQLIQNNSQNIVAISDNLGTEIKQTGENANMQISSLGGDLKKNRLYWIIVSFVLLLLGGIMYLFLGNRIKSNKTDAETQIKITKQTLEEESVTLDNKLIEILESQLKLKQEESKTQTTVSIDKDDHSLALKVADEIVRMQKNISRMDEGTKGLKPLEKGIERIRNNFAVNGYEMVNLLNKDYDERMNVDVINFIIDENIEKGKRIITKIVKPQVNYRDALIQRAQIEVSQN